jgi:hypothetical protein
MIIEIRTKCNDWKEAIIVFANSTDTWRMEHKAIGNISVPSHIGWYWTFQSGSYTMWDKYDEQVMIIRKNWGTKVWSIETGRKIWNALLEMGYEVVS